MNEYEEMAGRFWNAAKSYLSAAIIIEQADEMPSLIVPCMQNTGHSLELFLKAHLIKKTKSTRTIRTHNLEKLWQDSRMDEIRSSAELILNQHRDNKKKPYLHHITQIVEMKAEKNIDEYVRTLSSVFSEKSDYALRYPQKLTIIPSPNELLVTLQRLYELNPPLTCLR